MYWAINGVSLISNITRINAPAQRFSAASRDDEDGFQQDEQQTHLFFLEYQFSQFSGPTIRRSCKFGIKLGRAHNVCRRPTDLEVDEELSNFLMTFGCDEVAVDLWVDETLPDEPLRNANPNVRILKLSRRVSYFFQIRNFWQET